MVNLTFLDTVKLLADPNIWLGYMAATIHITPHAVGRVPNGADKLKGCPS